MRVMVTTAAAMTLAGMMAGCATAPRPGAPVAIESESISYETAPCFGTCPVYRVTILPDGSGVFEGIRFTAVTGTREFRPGADAYRRFAAALAPYRPVGERLIQPGTPDCGNAPTDMPSVDVRWSELSGASHRLNFYYGCGQSNRAMAEALRAAPQLLPIAGLIGKR